MLKVLKKAMTTLVVGAAVTSSIQAVEKIDFNRDIRPILSDKCFHCHGPDKEHRKGKLRLDIREDAIKEKSGIQAIVPGDSFKSELVARIETEDEDEIMPPPESHKKITPEEHKLLTQWIDEGAEYQDFWFYVKPEKSVTPKVKGPTHNEIDQYIQAKLEKEGFSPSKEADKRTLLRRVYLDLIGLPPTPEEVKEFIGDSSQNAYEMVVDRLLKKKAFGERMAVNWLDLVRYADTVGYHGDQNVSQSPYRDYVIEAFNQNMPYDQFTKEQLAGDLLEGSTQSQKIASAYNRLNMTTEEGGAQPKEYLAKYANDRVRNVSAVWMGSTVGCAECHDHKFDPFTAKDYYSFAAFFADLKEVGKYGARKRPPEIFSKEVNQINYEKYQNEKGRLEKSLTTFTPAHEAEFLKWKAESKNSQVRDVVWIEDLPVKKARGELKDWKLVDRKNGQVNTGNQSRLQEGKGTLVQHIFNLDKKIKISENDQFYVDVWLDPKNPPKSIMLQANDKNWEHRAYWGEDKIVFGGIGKDTPSHKKIGDLPALGQWNRLYVDVKLIGFNKATDISALAFTQFGGKVYWDQVGLRTKSISDSVQKLVKVEKLNPKQLAQLKKYYMEDVYVDHELLAAIAELSKKIKHIEQTDVTVPVSVAQAPREIRVLPRGNWLDESGEVVQAAIPEFLGKLDTNGQRATRLDLANWLMDKENPLTARVFVNNVWAMFMGTALSKVQNDLGGQGEWPSHLRLLDWLAIEFMDSQWNMKHIIKLMVMSHTYRQSSLDNLAIREKDPFNRLLTHQSRFQIQAEFIRDHALKTSGLLVDEVGGVSVKPYQPKGYYAELNFPRRTYESSQDENQYRRGLYTHWQRTFLHPAMKAFDAPSRESCTAARSRSNTPLQALALMNDPTFVEAARYLAARSLTEVSGDASKRIDWVYQQILLKNPDKETKSILEEVYYDNLSQYKKATAEAEKILLTGLSKKGENVDKVSLAAMTAVTRVIYNLHEVITRN